MAECLLAPAGAVAAPYLNVRSFRVDVDGLAQERSGSESAQRCKSPGLINRAISGVAVRDIEVDQPPLASRRAGSNLRKASADPSKRQCHGS